VDKLLSAGKTLSTLEQLQQTLDELGAREASLIEGRERELTAIRRKFDALKTRSVQESEALAEKNREILDAERQGLEARFTSRKQRIDQAWDHAKTALHEVAEQTRSQRKYENQKELLLANRVYDADLQALDQTHKALLSELSLEVGRLEGVRHAGWHVFRGYRAFRNWFQREAEATTAVSSDGEAGLLLESLRSHLNQLESQLGFAPQNALARLFSVLSPWVMLLCVAAGGALALFVPQVSSAVGLSADQLLGWGGVVAGLVVGAYGLGFMMARSQVRAIIDLFSRSSQLITHCQSAADQSKEKGVASIEQSLQEVEARLDASSREADAVAVKQLEAGLAKLGPQHERLIVRHEQMAETALTGVTVGKLTSLGGGGTNPSTPLHQVESDQQSMEEEAMGRFRKGIDELVADWNGLVPDGIAQLKASQGAMGEMTQPWNTAASKNWQAPESGDPVGGFAELVIDLKPFLASPPVDSRMALEMDTPLRVPLAFKIPSGESILFESEGTAPQAMIDAINGIVLRLLMSAPVGRMRFTLMDPVGLGQNFAGLMHLADHDDQLINRRIWTQGNQIEQCLKDLTEHMEKVTQMYLRNEYDSLADYNQAAGNIAEKYQVLVVSDFPVGFSESALRRLQSIAVSGARCGVFLLLHRDQRQPLPDPSVIDDLRKHCVWIESKSKDCPLGAHRWTGVRMEWAEQADAQGAMDLIHQIGRASVDSNRVEVPFSQVMPATGDTWSQDTSDVLKIPIGRTGASKLQYLVLGKGTQQHVLIAGKTGSGKSTLFHVMITNLALWCRPDQVEFYLIDFKKGVEFKCYATHQLPHAKVVAIESDREFGLSVLERVDQELRRRGDLFRQHGVQDLGSYQKVARDQPLPRTLVMIDEFQEYFVADDRVAQNASVLLDRIVRQGRAFGIHVILGSQTLGGAYTLARTTFAQMVVRIALQCDEADSYLIMDESNAAPRLLSRPGEGIYNDRSGAVEGNSPFQTVWLTDAERDAYLQQVSGLVQHHQWKGSGPVVFEGNAPADVRDNHELTAALATDPTSIPEIPHAWLGTPNAIKGPTCGTFGAQTGGHLLVLGQNDEMAFSLMICSIISLAAQYPADQAEFIVIDALADHSIQLDLLDQVLSMVPHKVRTLRDESLEEMMTHLDGGVDQHSEDSKGIRTSFVVVLGLQLFKKLRPEDEFSFSVSEAEGKLKPGEIFDRIILEGPGAGIHVLATVDSYSNSQRFLSRKALSEFEMRVLFQMSANDSAALIDHTKASQLGLYRALFYNERRGYLETFRPYALPDQAWLSELREALEKRSPHVPA
jgi:DNA segregation ATPase FtsK/SpoIIIE, S-DNA-T family